MINSQPQYENTTIYFICSDLGLSNCLVTRGYEVITIDNTNPRKALFIFKRTSKLEKDVSDYWNGNIRVNAHDFMNNLKTLKNRIYIN